MDYISMPKIDLDPGIKKSIFIIVLLIFGVLCVLSLFNGGGMIGGYLSQGLAWLFGWGKWFFPMIILALVFFLYNDDKYSFRGINYLGLFIFIISFQAILHFFVPMGEWKEMVGQGIGGGFTGWQLALGFYKILGFWGGVLVVIGLLLISLMLMFEANLSRLIGRESIFAKILYPFKMLFSRLFQRREKEEEEEEFEEEIEPEEEPEEEDRAEEEIPEIFSKTRVSNVPDFMDEEKAGKEEKEADKYAWRPSHIKINLPQDLLSGKTSKSTGGDIKNNQLIIQRTLENFGIVVEMGEVSVGPTVTQYTFKPAEGVKLSRITTLNNDLAMALAAHPIRIEAPIPGRSLVGVEVPNQVKAVVRLKEILEDKDFKDRKSNLMVALGKDVSGKAWLYNLARMPHLLVAGATNSGKSVCLNTIIVSLLYQNNPDDLKMIMVDPKRVELPIYNGIPHLITPVITDVSKTINALKWCLNEMDRRFEMLAQARKKDIQSYNLSSKEKMPYLIFIIDELADLMVVASKDIEGSVIRLAQMARAVGIHLILATQRPSVDVITGLIKANMPARIAFSVASGVDSKTILDSLGAEKLLGQGDMLFVTAEISKPKRIQGAFVSENEIKRIANYLKEQGGEPNYLEGVTERQKVKGFAGVGLAGESEDDDDLLEEAKEIIINSGKASASFLQRRLSVGYARASRLLDILEDRGVVGPSNGAKPREIMISREQYEALTNEGVSGVSLHSREEAQAPEEYFASDNEEENDDSDDDDDDNDHLISSEQVDVEQKGKKEQEGSDDVLDEIREKSNQKKDITSSDKNEKKVGLDDKFFSR